MIHHVLSRVPRRLLLGLVPALLVIGASGAHPAFATTVADVVNAGNGKCLSQENVGPVIDVCDGTTRQDWKLVNVPNHARDNLIRNDLTGECLSILDNNRSVGAQVNTHQCDFSGGNPFELWFPLQSSLPTEIANEGDGGLVMHPSGCMPNNDLPIFMNVPGQCAADFWNLPLS